MSPLPSLAPSVAATATLNVVDLFSGIGGFSLGLERTGGFRTVAFCEINPYAGRVLARHWPGVPIFEDIRALTAASLAGAGIERVDVLCGGFPCQDISVAGAGAGLAGERSGLWFEFHRVIAETRPKWVIIENVAVLRSRGLETVLGGLAALGYDAEWHCIPAAAVGAPHRRDRVWIVAEPSCELPYGRRKTWKRRGQPSDSDKNGPHASHYAPLSAGIRRGDTAGAWRAEPDVGRVADGVPKRVDRLRCLGNAVVPQIPEMIGRAILAAEAG